MNSRFKNYALWVALASLIGLFVQDAGLLAPEKYDEYVNAVLAVLIAAGVIVNPSLGKGLKDEGVK
ncbi:holin [Rossellomorea vietnamensis]|uniref:Holin n=1 Tax=Rossellomorea vietnamensis TaxID=218284 RepID=A0A5D4KEI2_9BACI|nr:holin [Rossellomorea vietnamensis]TYR75592.1 holin [Rossellomorea vietnamensis]